MHELGIVYQIIKVVDQFARENGVTEVDKIVLEIGQLSGAIPKFIKECYPAAVDGTAYESAKLEIITLPANGKCRGCSNIYNIVENRKVCPECESQDFELISGREFNIKEIVAY